MLLKRGCEIPTYAIGVILQRRILHWILLRLAAYIAVVVAVGLLFLAGASVYDVAEAGGDFRANGSLENIFEFLLVKPPREFH